MSPRIRPGDPGDAGVLGKILWRFQHDHDWMPELYTLWDCIRYCEAMIARGWVTVAEIGEEVRGFMARDGAEVCALYLACPARGRGLGHMLVEEAKAQEGELWLRCAEANARARAFYHRQGFVEAGRGAENDGNLPDVVYVWPGGERA